MNDSFLDPVLDDPYTAADSIREQRLNQGLSATQQQVWSGELTEQEGALLSGQITQQLKAIRGRKQTQKDAASYEAYQQAQQQAAMLQTITLENQRHLAENFQNLSASYLDPITGDVAHFFQKKPGEWEQIEFPEAEQQGAEGEAIPHMAAEGGDEEEQAEPPTAPPAQLGFAQADQRQGGNFGGLTGFQPTLRQVPSATGGEKHQMEIINGDRREVYEFDRDPSSPTGWKGPRLISSGQVPQQPGQLSQAEINKEVHKAEMAYRGMPESAAKRHGVAALANRLVERRMLAKQHEVDLAGRSGLAATHEQALKEREQRKKERDQTIQQVSQDLKHYENEVRKEKEKWEKDKVATDTMPEEFKDIHKEARKRYEEHKKHVKELTGQPAQQPVATGGKEPPPAPPAGKTKAPEPAKEKGKDVSASVQAFSEHLKAIVEGSALNRGKPAPPAASWQFPSLFEVPGE